MKFLFNLLEFLHVFDFFYRLIDVFKKTPNQSTANYHTSVKLLQQVQALLDDIETKNIKIVGCAYSRSHNNQTLVGSAIGYAKNRVYEVTNQCPDEQFIEQLIANIEQSKTIFLENQYDPDGVCAGTLVDVVLALKKYG